MIILSLLKKEVTYVFKVPDVISSVTNIMHFFPFGDVKSHES